MSLRKWFSSVSGDASENRKTPKIRQTSQPFPLFRTIDPEKRSFPRFPLFPPTGASVLETRPLGEGVFPTRRNNATK
jgi:hypothetical protein